MENKAWLCGVTEMTKFNGTMKVKAQTKVTLFSWSAFVQRRTKFWLITFPKVQRMLDTPLKPFRMSYIVRVAGDKIRTDILEEVKRAKFYSIIADEVTDASNKEELSLVIRYVHEGQIREVFVDFVEVERITGRVLGEAILKWLRDHNIPPADMRGQCYDGASSMAGARSGVKAVVQEFAPKTMYFHCAAHRLNLSVVSACSIQAFKNAES